MSRRLTRARLLWIACLGCMAVAAASAQAPGYYRFPALHGDRLAFTAEGDLWTVDLTTHGEDGSYVARRLTTHLGEESHPAFSPDGRQIAFTAEYEGAAEVYVMPVGGGLPRRLTWDGDGSRVVGWTPGGEVLYATRHDSTVPAEHLVALDPSSRQRRTLPLRWASEGSFQDDGTTLFFTRFGHYSSHFKRYRGGHAQSVWRFTPGAGEAQPLTGDFAGTSKTPMWWQGRVYFVSDRDGTLNLWSMDPRGGDLRQHTRHREWDVKWAKLDAGRVVYQRGADLHLFDIATGADRRLDIVLTSDFDQRRSRWVDEPMTYLTAAHLSPDGDRVVLTARGQVFVVPVEQGRRIEVTRQPGVRYRSARFLTDGTQLVALSDESGEVELWQLDSRGVEASRQLTEDATTLRFDTLPSPTGAHIAFHDKDNVLWLYTAATDTVTQIAASRFFDVGGTAWSPDGRWLAYTVPAPNHFRQIRLFDTKTGNDVAVTSDRFPSDAPAWSSDGRFLYFLTDRNLRSTVGAPWGDYAPQPHLDERQQLFVVALTTDARSPFAPVTELHPNASEAKPAAADETTGSTPETSEPEAIEIDLEGLQERLYVVPTPPGNYASLTATEDHLYWLRSPTGQDAAEVVALAIERDAGAPTVVASGIESFERSADGKKLLLRKDDALFVVPADGKAIEQLAPHQLDLSGWRFPLDPVEEWRQMLTDAWRLHRDYFYDPGMHGRDWTTLFAKVEPLLARVTDRAELSDLFAELVSELSASHHYVGGGDHREGDDEDVEPASLGAVLEADPGAGGHRITRLYRADPDLPSENGPLGHPELGIEAGDVVLAINGTPTLDVADPGVLLRHQAGQQVLLRVRDHDMPAEDSREIIVVPITPRQERDLRYSVWEYERRQHVESWADGKLGYVHLRAMGNRDYSAWARHVFPVLDRPGLVIDARNNRGGNIDSWILGFLLRRPWMWWKPRTGDVYPNMQDAYGGHTVVLCDAHTWSDGEAFCEGFRRLGLGKVVGRRTGGGEIWLTSSNRLVDRGIATAAEFGVFGPEGTWLIEGHGVEPDIDVDNLPHATFTGEDTQLRAAVDHLLGEIERDPPVLRPEAPPYKDLSPATGDTEP